MKSRILVAAALGGLAAIASAQSIVINEFVANHVSTDTNEYIELLTSPNVDLSTYRILSIEGDAGASVGTIDAIITPGTTNAAGYWTTGFLNSVLENGTMSLLLVGGFTGSLNQDLDTNNDGVFDITPWASIVDSIAVTDGGANDFMFGGVGLAPNFDGGTLSVGGASRIPNGVDTNSPGDWKRNNFNLVGLPSITGTLAPNEALNTPNAVNAVPEPGTLAALAIGAALLSRRRAR